MAGSIISGQLIARTGRYRIFPIIGTALMVVGAAPVRADRRRHAAVEDHADHGARWGSASAATCSRSSPPSQNAVSPREIGVATSSVTFFRSMGGTLGAAVFLSVLFSILPGQDQAAPSPPPRHTPGFQAAPPAHPDQVQRPSRPRGQGGASALNDTSFINRLADAVSRTRSRSASPTR